MILISDLVTDSQELGQVVLPSTLILGCTHFSSLIGSSLDQMEVLRCHSNTWQMSALLVLCPALCFDLRMTSSVSVSGRLALICANRWE